ncbi:hypothetical protein DTO212C5_8801 [Paecilomyces variotii]|nr:hypothetical protein DTO212C5_8801 [Paecilomyces variotii]
MEVPGLVLPPCDLSDDEQQSDTDQARSPTREYSWTPTPEPRGASATPYDSYYSPSPNESALPPIRETSSPLQLAPPNNRRPRVYFSEQEESQIIHWLLSHRHEYADKNITRAEFWERYGNWVQEEFRKNYHRIDRSIQQIMQKRRHKVDEAIKASGVASSDTD